MNRKIITALWAHSMLLLCAGSAIAQSSDFTLQNLGNGVWAAIAAFTLQNLGNGVWAAIAADAGKAGSNAGFVVGDNGLMVIDTFESPEAARELLAAIRKVSSLPIRFVVNTHYHLDHVNGNDIFAGAGAVIVAHRNVRAWMRTDNLKWWGDAIKPEDKARVQSLKLPDLIYDDGIVLFLGRRAIEVRFLQGHTGGDSVVRVPDASVIFCGDLLWKDHIPNLIDASTQQWITTLDSLLDNYAQYTFVPGHGGLANSGDVSIFRDYLVGLRAAVQASLGKERSGDDLVNDVLLSLKQKYGGWGFFHDFAKDNILQTAEEFTGTKRPPQLVEPLH